jgi:L-ascorbate metabolism protein UlaG (beta-lactamase superfamily)
MADQMNFRWLGTAGIELEYRGERILIDPYLSRFPIWNAVFGRPVPKPALVSRYLSPARAVLISHAHYDHLLDVPNVCRAFGATAYGSSNTSEILRAHALPEGQVKTMHAGDLFAVEPFTITVLAGKHGRMAGILPFTGKLPARLRPPLRLSDYRMDSMFSFRVQTPQAACLIWNSPESQGVPCADVLFFNPLWGTRNCAAVAAAARARLIVPVHWDDFFQPLDRPQHPLLVPPGWNSPWVRRMEPHAFSRALKKRLPAVHVCVPEIFKTVDWNGSIRVI